MLSKKALSLALRKSIFKLLSTLGMDDYIESGLAQAIYWLFLS
jgi:hypothetical protein